MIELTSDPEQNKIIIGHALRRNGMYDIEVGIAHLIDVNKTNPVEAKDTATLEKLQEFIDALTKIKAGK